MPCGARAVSRRVCKPVDGSPQLQCLWGDVRGRPELQAWHMCVSRRNDALLRRRLGLPPTGEMPQDLPLTAEIIQNVSRPGAGDGKLFWGVGASASLTLSKEAESQIGRDFPCSMGQPVP